MKAYLDIVQRVLEQGYWKYPTRRDNNNKVVPVDGGVKTLALPNQLFSHNMSEGFPLLTTKKMPIRTIAVELEGFIQGITSKSWYQEHKCKIWNEWANPQAVEKIYNSQEEEVFSKKELQAKENDLGPIYGYSWRNFGK